MKKIITFCLGAVSVINVSAQTVAFRNTYPDVTISSASQTMDHGYIIAGFSTVHTIGSKDIIMMKTDSTGVIQWIKTFGNNVNSGADDIAGNAVEIPDGSGYYLTGQFWNQGNNTYEIYVLKTDTAGNRLWSKTMFNGGYDRGMSVDNAQGSGCLVTGWLGNSNRGYLGRLDSSGTLLWQKAIYGAPGAWVLHSGRVTPDGGTISCGYDNELGTYEMWLIRTNYMGTTLWQTGYSITGTFNFAYDVCLAGNGYVIAGGSNALNLVKTDSTGTILWANVYSGVNANPRGYSVRQCSDGGFIILGNDIGGDEYLMKTDSNGSVSWTMKYPGGYAINTVEQTSDGGFVIAQGSDLIKTDASGNTGCSDIPFTMTSSVLSLNTRTTGAGNLFQLAINSPADSSTSPFLTPTFCFTTAVTDFESQRSINVIPNPATSEITVQSLKLNLNSVEIYNALGEKVYSNAEGFYSNVETINVSKLSSGIYFVKVGTEGGRMIGATKFIKQ